MPSPPPHRAHTPPSTTDQTFAPALGDPREHLARAQRFLHANDRSGARHAYRQALESASNRDLAASFLSHVRLAQLSGDTPRAVQGHLESAWGLRGYLSEHLRPQDAVGSYFRVVGLQLANMYAQAAGSRGRESEVLRALESMGLEERGGKEDDQHVMRTAAAAATAAAASTPAAVAAIVPAAAPTTTVAAAASAPPPAAVAAAAAAAAAAGSLLAAVPVDEASAAVLLATTGGRRGAGGGIGRGHTGRGRRGRRGGGVVQTCQPGRGGGRQGRCDLARRDGVVHRNGGSRDVLTGSTAAVSYGDCGREIERGRVEEGERGGEFFEGCTGALDKASAEVRHLPMDMAWRHPPPPLPRIRAFHTFC